MSYTLRLPLANQQQRPKRVVIYGGTIFEVEDPLSGAQNLVTTSETSVTIPPGGSQTIEVDTWCLNHRFTPPNDTPMRATMMSTTLTYADQQDLWADMDKRR
jgi:hypothetical protein